MKAPVVLKKYGNRRLYDANRSGYVTLADVRDMLQQGEDIQVVDAKSGEDLTKTVLVQMILEAENTQEALPVEFLKQVIRLANSPTREVFAKGLSGFVQPFLDLHKEAGRTFLDAQRDFQQQLQVQMSQQMQQWQQMQQQWALAASSSPLGFFQNPFAVFAPPPRAAEPPPAVSPPVAPMPARPASDSELGQLREQLAATQALVQGLIQEKQASAPAQPVHGSDGNQPQPLAPPAKDRSALASAKDVD